MTSACPITRLDEKKGKMCHVRVSDLLHIYSRAVSFCFIQSKIGSGFLLLTGGKISVAKGVYNREGIIVDILGDKNKLVEYFFNLPSFISQTLSIASIPLPTVYGSKAFIRFLFPLWGL